MSGNFNRLLKQVFLLHHLPATSGSVRLYGRWMHRSPAKVLLPFEEKLKTDLKKEKLIELDPSTFTKYQQSQPRDDQVCTEEDQHSKPIITSEKAKEIKQKREEKLKKRKFYLSQQKIFDDNNEIIYEKLKENDARISDLFVKLKSKKERLRSGQMLVEGWRMIVDGLEAKCTLKYIIFSQIEDVNNLRPFLPKTGIKFFKVPYKELQRWSDVETSPGIFGIFETPTADNVKSFSRPLPLQFVCDNVRVPGNLGTILRIAVGAGCEKVLLSKGCVDMWDAKVIRSGAGAHFRLPIYHSIDWIEMPNHLEPETSLFIADSNTNSDNGTEDNIQIPVLPYYGVEFSTLKHITLIIGGETEGISEDSYALASSKNGLRLNIPLQRGVDSLNTGMASAVIAFEIRKQLIQAWTKQKHAREAQAA